LTVERMTVAGEETAGETEKKTMRETDKRVKLRERNTR